MSDSVFICHSSADHNFVLKLAQKLKEDAIDVWIDDWMIEVGDSIIYKVEEGLEASDFFIVIYSKSSIESNWVKKELNSTLLRQLRQEDITILPVLLNISPEMMPILMQDIYAAKFRSGEIIQTEYEKLLRPILKKRSKSILNKFQDQFFSNVEHIDLILKKQKPSIQEIDFIISLIQEEKYLNYVLKIADKLIWFDILKENGYFNINRIPFVEKSDQSNIQHVKLWNILPFLERLVKELNQAMNKKYIADYIDIISSVSTFQLENENVIINGWTWEIFVKILLELPCKNIPIHIIEMLDIWINYNIHLGIFEYDIFKLLAKFLSEDATEENVQKSEKIIEIITKLKWKEEYDPFQEKDTKKPKFLLDNYRLIDGFNALSKKIVVTCSNKIIFILSDRLIEVLKNRRYTKGYDGSHIWFKSLHHDRALPPSDTEHVLSLIIRNILKEKAEVDSLQTKKILDQYLSNRYIYHIFKRYVLYIVGLYFEKYRSYFMKFLEIENEPFEKESYESELLILFQNNINIFTENEKKIIRVLLNKHEQRLRKHKKNESYINNEMQQWYFVLKEDSNFNKDYKKLKKLTGNETVMNFIGFSSRSGPGTSPLSKKEILDKPNVELARFLKNFKTKNIIEGPTVEGLSIVLQTAVQENPSTFTSDLSVFKETAYFYIYHIFAGFANAWKDNKEIDWDKILSFIELYLELDDFWNDKYILDESYRANHRWVIGEIGNLLEEGTKNENNFLPDNLIQKVIDIIGSIIEKIKIEEYKGDDPLTYTINSPLGKNLESLFFIGLYLSKKKSKKIKKKWPDDIKTRFDNLLNNNITESLVLFGLYLPNFYFMDESWTVKNIVDLIKIINTKKWSQFMNGYLFSSKIYKFIYSQMLTHYKAALSYPFKDRYSSEGLIEHLMLGYLWKFDDEFKGCLFKQMLTNKPVHELSDVIIHISRLEETYKTANDDIDFKQRIESLIFGTWFHIYKNLHKKKKLSENEKNIVSQTVYLAPFVQVFNETNFELLLFTAEFTQYSHNTPDMIKHLNSYLSIEPEDKSLKYIGNIFIKMINSLKPDVPIYKDEHIRNIVDKLFKSGDNDNISMAEEICEIFGKSGRDEILRDVYYEYH